MQLSSTRRCRRLEEIALVSTKVSGFKGSVVLTVRRISISIDFQSTRDDGKRLSMSVYFRVMSNVREEV